MSYQGELAALGAAFCWSFTLVFFTSAGEKIGSFAVNLIRMTFAIPLLLFTTIFRLGTDYSTWFAGGDATMLALSGVVGLALGDAAFFQALIMIGPRKSALIFSTAPIITSLFAIPLLGETLGFLAWTGILLTVAGVFWVINERNSSRFAMHGKKATWGVIFAFIATLCQSIGLIMSKAGMAGTIDPFAATLMRMLAAMLSMWIVSLVANQFWRIRHAFTQRKAILLTAGGTIVGPFLGVSLSLFAVRYTEAGIAATLMATLPILTIPVVWYVYHEKTSPRALIGTIGAVLGIVLLFQR